MKRKGIFVFMAAIICMAGMVLLTGCGAEDKTTLGEAYGIDKEELYSVSLYYDKAGSIEFSNCGESEVEGRKTLRYGQELLAIRLGEELPEQKMCVNSFEARLWYNYNQPVDSEREFEELVLRQYDDFIVIGEMNEEKNEIVNCKYYANNIDIIDAICRLKEMLVANKDDHDFIAHGDYIGFNTKEKYGDDLNALSEKPVIYCYPEQTTDIEVKLDQIRLTCTYPEYQDGWNVTAKQDGSLAVKGSGREYYCLYYEGEANLPMNKDCGFVVEKEDYRSFLEEKLAVLGLTEREAQEFIIYWLPVMQEHDRLFVHFVEQGELEQAVPLSITPKPDTVIRVHMQIFDAGEGREVKEQKLGKVLRMGYTVVEWGGSNNTKKAGR